MTLDDLLDSWRINNAINLEFLDICQESDFELKPGKGKTIRSNFVHIVGVRRSWLEEKMPKEAVLIPKLDWKTATKEEIANALELSRDLMARLIRKLDEATRPGKWNAVSFYSYCLVHESHHRSQIELTLRLNNREPDDKFLYGIWEWTKK